MTLLKFANFFAIFNNFCKSFLICFGDSLVLGLQQKQKQENNFNMSAETLLLSGPKFSREFSNSLSIFIFALTRNWVSELSLKLLLSLFCSWAYKSRSLPLSCWLTVNCIVCCCLSLVISFVSSRLQSKIVLTIYALRIGVFIRFACVQFTHSLGKSRSTNNVQEEEAEAELRKNR